jgi:hypothetical protein
MAINVNTNTLGASARRGLQVASLSWTTEETGVFSGEIRMIKGPMKVDWGDGTVEEIEDGADNLTHDYGGLSGDKKITVTFLEGYEDVTEFGINNTNSKGDLTNWNISGLTNLSIFFLHSNSFSGDLSRWDISGLTNLSALFIHNNSFSGDLSGWGISGLTSLERFYIFNNSFSGDLSGWGISGLTNLRYFYINSNSFTGDLSGWDISGLTSLSRFYIDSNSFTGVSVLTSNAAFGDGIDVEIQNNTGIPDTNVSNFIIGLDDYDGSNGNLDASGTNGGSMTYADLSAAAQTAHDNLVNNKGWSITLDT